MYKVTAILRMKDGGFNAIHLDGIYVTKGETISGDKIRKQCSDEIRKRIKLSKDFTTEDREKAEIVVKYQLIKHDFIVLEDK